MSNELIRVILVDDHPAVRRSIKTLLDSNPRFQLVAVCEDGQFAIEQAVELTPDIMLVDINMSPVNGFMVTEKVLEKRPSIKIIALTINNQPKYVTQMLESGARGYLTKTSPPKEIIRGIIEVYNGKIYLCNEVKNFMPPSE